MPSLVEQARRFDPYAGMEERGSPEWGAWMPPPSIPMNQPPNASTYQPARTLGFPLFTSPPALGPTAVGRIKDPRLESLINSLRSR